jgi:LPXTG-site transpeptidase (sortase) family protein
MYFVFIYYIINVYMLFTEIEKDIAKQIIKIGLVILLFFILITGLIKIVYFVNNSNETIIVDPDGNKETITVNKVISKKELPLSLEIPGYKISTIINSPNSTDVKVLDNSLSNGAVYYPGSGMPGSDNTLIFGHSTTFKIVMNKAYQVFNDLKNVKPGSLIYVKTATETHIYRAVEVKRVSKYTSWIQFKSEKPMLTLATCDSFGKASDRWVLTADYVGVK